MVEIEHDPDDPPPEERWIDHYWYIFNRMAEWGMYYARLCGFI